MEKTFKLRIGALSDPIYKQLTEQGFDVQKTEMAHFQKDADAITRLKIRGLAPAGMVEKLNFKLVKNIEDHLNNI